MMIQALTSGAPSAARAGSQPPSSSKPSTKLPPLAAALMRKERRLNRSVEVMLGGSALIVRHQAGLHKLSARIAPLKRSHTSWKQNPLYPFLATRCSIPEMKKPPPIGGVFGTLRPGGREPPETSNH